MKPVTTKTASLDTMSVTIKALHVEGKQMTLAVFRQLPEGEERDDSDLWGIVRYTIKDDDIWLVFSQNAILYRRALYLRKPCIGHYEQRTQNELEEKVNKAKSNLSESIEEKKQWIRDDTMDYWNDRICQYQETLEFHTQKFEEKKKTNDEWMKKDTARYKYEKKLSELTQLFIAV